MTTVADALRQAVTHHQQGRLAAAEGLYRAILAKDRFHDEALHLLGVLCHQTGRDEESLTLLQAAISRRKRDPKYHSHLGLTLEALGRPAEAEQAHQRAISLAPDNASFRNNLGVLLLNSGRPAEAKVHFQQAAAQRAGYADAANNLGLCLERLGDTQAARAAYAQAVALAPQHPVFASNYGALLQVLGEFEAAMVQFGRSLTLAPDAPDTLSNLALLLHRMGRSDEALAHLDQALKAHPRHAGALHNRAHVLHGLGRLAEAVTGYEAVLAADPRHLRACLDLASLHQRAGDVDAAARMIWRALALDPAHVGARMQLVGLLPLAKEATLPDATARATVEGWVVELLRTNGLAGGVLRAAAARLLRTHDAWADFPATPDEGHLDRLREDALLLAVLPRASGTDPGFETRVVAMRSALLGALDSPGGDRFLPLACALAGHAFMSEYVYDETQEDTLALAALEALLGAGQRTPLAVAVYGAFRPLEAQPWADALLAEGAALPAPLLAVLTQTVVEPRRERTLAESVEALTPIDDAVSHAVRAQYEANPYPRWRMAPVTSQRPWHEGFRNRFPWLSDVALPGGTRTLVAGCGTGHQPLRLALSHPELEIVALDLSRRSLGYGVREAEALPQVRVRFGHGDVLALPAAESLGTFDIAYATGVLHHMRDPEAGLRAVLSRVNPGGIVHVGLYSRLARRRLAPYQRAAAGSAGDLDAIRALRRRIQRDATDPDALDVMQYPDFYSASECRDLLMHVQEHQFDLAAVEAMLDRAGLDFLAFEFDDPRIEPAFAAEMGPVHGGREAALRSLAAWGAYEARHPDTFRNMYQLFARKR